MSVEDKELRVVSTREDATEEYSFDALAKGLASGTISRRKALKLMGTAILGAGVLTVFSTGEADADVEAADVECPDSRVGCNTRCRETGRCRCVRTVTGNSRCVRPCCSRRTCTTNAQCNSGELCMTTNCCRKSGANHGVCVTQCQEPRPNYCDRERF